MSDYPEHDKLSAVADESQTIGEFLDYNGLGYMLGEHVQDGNRFVPVNKSITVILAEYFHIDLTKIEAEKREMIEKMRSMA